MSFKDFSWKFYFYCNRLRPLCYLLLNHWAKFNQIWCVIYSHEWGMQTCKGKFVFGPTSWGPWEGLNGQISFNFNYKVNLKDFYTKLYVFSQMKNIKHIRQDFHSVAWVMPQGWYFGVLGMPRGSKKIQTWSYGISN